MSFGAVRSLIGAASAAVCAKLSAALVVGAWSIATAQPPFPRLPLFLAILAVFGIAGAILVVRNRDDRRAVHLGVFFLLCAGAFGDTILLRAAPDGSLLEFAARVPLDAFLPLFLWLFVRDFPAEIATGTPRRVARAGVRVAQVAGWLLFAANVAIALGEVGALPRVAGLLAFSRHEPTAWFAPVLFALALPCLPYALWRARSARPDERRRVVLFLCGIVAGFAPLVFAILAEALIPGVRAWLDRPGVSDAMGWVLYPAFLSIPATTAWAVVVHRALDLRLVVRKAIQYALARWTVTAVTVLPLVFLVAWMWRHRNQTLADMLSQAGPAALIALSVSGALGLAYGARWMEAIDRRFFRESYDARRLLLDLVEVSRAASSPAELAELWMRGLDRALHLESVAVYVLDPFRERFSATAGGGPSVPAAAAVVTLLAEAPDPMDVDLDSPRSVLRRLPVADREWLAATGAQVLQPLLSSDGRLSGFLALGPKKSELPFSEEDRSLLSAVAAAGSMTLENRLLRSSPRPSVAGGEFEDAAASAAGECAGCGNVDEASTESCGACGGVLTAAALPRLLRGKFRLERRIGSGGMGVVYRARDVELGRGVAIKVLPRMSPEHAVRLRREARAMAALSHENLATIYALEVWRGAPVIVAELLEGGTLSRRLAAGALGAKEVAGLGVALASTLEHVHAAGMLHRDIKPSNIGFTSQGKAKLLDFGLVRLLDAVPREDRSTLSAVRSGEATADGSAASLTLSHRLVGTPLYVSPEAVRGERPDVSFDLWGLAITLYEAVVGAHPFAGSSLQHALERIRRAEVPPVRSLAPQCPEGLARFLADALSARRGDRPASAREFRERLQAALG